MMISTNGGHRSKFLALWKKGLVDRQTRIMYLWFTNIVGNGKSAINDANGGHGC
jgi:hypothetical protein